MNGMEFVPSSITLQIGLFNNDSNEFSLPFPRKLIIFIAENPKNCWKHFVNVNIHNLFQPMKRKAHASPNAANSLVEINKGNKFELTIRKHTAIKLES